MIVSILGFLELPDFEILYCITGQIYLHWAKVKQLMTFSESYLHTLHHCAGECHRSGWAAGGQERAAEPGPQCEALTHTKTQKQIHTDTLSAGVSLERLLLSPPLSSPLLLCPPLLSHLVSRMVTPTEGDTEEGAQQCSFGCASLLWLVVKHAAKGQRVKRQESGPGQTFHQC